MRNAFRIFVSSTFADAVVERNHLQEHVFPRLRQLTRERGFDFEGVDLRWGVGEEAALDQQTMPICLAELRRCQRISPRPNFVVLVGHRYGWRPLPSSIDADEFEELMTALTSAERELIAANWYRRDDNALIPSSHAHAPASSAAATSCWRGSTSTSRPIRNIR